MITTIGSQNREPLSESRYSLVSLNDGEAILCDHEFGKLEYWYENDHHAGYTIEINGIGYEFARSEASK